jgi:hypothetical protein
MNNKVAQVLADAGESLVKLAAERDTAVTQRDEALAKLAQMATRLEAEKTAAQMHEKGMRTETSFMDLSDELEKEAGNGRLPVIQEAVKMAAPNMAGQVSLGSSDAGQTASAEGQLVSYLVGAVG